jgi:hypothetical protein
MTWVTAWCRPMPQRPASAIATTSRLPAAEIEDIIVKTINAHLIASRERPASGAANIGDGKAVTERAERIDVHLDRLVIRLKAVDREEASEAADENVVSIPWQKPSSRRSRQILVPHGVPKSEGPANADRTPCSAGQRNCPRASLARRDHIGLGDRRSADRITSEVQRASGQYDDLACVSRTGSCQGGGRRSPGARHWG